MDKSSSQNFISYKIAIFYIFCSIFFSCNSNEEKPPEPQLLKDMVIRVSEAKDKEILICYHTDSIATWADRNKLKDKFAPDDLKIIYALNRIDESRIRPGTELVVPDTLIPNIMAYSPFPKKLPMLQDIPKVVLIAQRIQAFALYKEGKLLRWGPVSAGKQSTPTPNGLHYGNYKSRLKISTVDKDWKLPFYFNIMNRFGVGIHQYVLPGYPASHACVRLRMQDAEFIYNWASQWTVGENGQKLVENGTPFMVFGEYDFNKPSPWKQLLLDSQNNKLNQDELDTLKEYSEAYKKDKNNSSGSNRAETDLADS